MRVLPGLSNYRSTPHVTLELWMRLLTGVSADGCRKSTEPFRKKAEWCRRDSSATYCEHSESGAPGPFSRTISSTACRCSALPSPHRAWPRFAWAPLTSKWCKRPRALSWIRFFEVRWLRGICSHTRWSSCSKDVKRFTADGSWASLPHYHILMPDIKGHIGGSNPCRQLHLPSFLVAFCSLRVPSRCLYLECASFYAATILSSHPPLLLGPLLM